MNEKVMKESIVIKIGGSLIFNEEGKADTEKIAEFCKIIKIRKKKKSSDNCVWRGIVGKRIYKNSQIF